MTTWFCDHAWIEGAIADDVVLETDYDSVCEYCGDVTTELDY